MCRLSNIRIEPGSKPVFTRHVIEGQAEALKNPRIVVLVFQPITQLLLIGGRQTSINQGAGGRVVDALGEEEM
jgi:hypothetical protein